MNLRIISAGAGSGKTYRLTHEMTRLLEGEVRADGIIATTFTNKAAAELQERVRVSLLAKGKTTEADELANAMIGTVHALGVRLLQRFAFEAGVSPQVDIIAEEDQQQLFNDALATVLTEERVDQMESLSERLGLTKRNRGDWREVLKQLTEIARSNDFSAAVLEKSRDQSFATFQDLLGAPNPPGATAYEEQLQSLLRGTIARLEHNEDTTKKTKGAISTLQGFLRSLENRGYLFWHEWAKLSKLGVGAKSREDIKDLADFTYHHYQHPGFHEDVKRFNTLLFDLAIAAIEEFDRYKKKRGLIDYTDMETQVNKLLDHPLVREVLQSEIDLLMVDEFQDTSPIQLEIFLKLSRIARYSIWVGDPKQSIYGFRGADPALMQAIIAQQGGIRPEDIQSFSWRSRELIVYTTNALFTKAFPNLPEAQVALKPKRCRDGRGQPDCLEQAREPEALGYPLLHWHFRHEGGSKRPPGRPWMEDCLADTLNRWLARSPHYAPKSGGPPVAVQPGDVAILCRSNKNCQAVAEALHRTGLKAAIARDGLLRTAEARYILACLKYLINPYDDLSVAEILMLHGSRPIEAIIESRLRFVAAGDSRRKGWAADAEIIKDLNTLRNTTLELSSAETLDLLLEALQLRRTIVSWGTPRQRLSNVDALRQYALQYESACNRLHTAASTGGFLIWLNELGKAGQDMQGSGEGPDAVNVLTYHRSKGLEWPVVICHDLENNLRADPWGFDIISERAEVDLDKVLDGRWLRYWVNPYADQYRNTYWHEQLEAHPASARAREQALAEEARLLYVGITRARDYLVFPTRQAPAKWLNRTWQAGEEDHPTLDPDSEETPWAWKGEFINIETEVLTYARDFTHADTAPQSHIPYLQAPAGKASHLPFDFQFPQDQIEEADVVCRSALAYSNPLPLPEGTDQQGALRAAAAFLSADRPGRPRQDRLEIAESLLSRYEVADWPARELARAGEAWQQALQHHFQPREHLRGHPMHYYYQGRLFSTSFDHLLRTPAGIVIVQHHLYHHSDPKKLKQRALSRMKDWAFLSLRGIQALLGEEQVRCLIHFPLSGQWVELAEKTGT